MQVNPFPNENTQSLLDLNRVLGAWFGIVWYLRFQWIPVSFIEITTNKGFQRTSIISIPLHSNCVCIWLTFPVINPINSCADDLVIENQDYYIRLPNDRVCFVRAKQNNMLRTKSAISLIFVELIHVCIKESSWSSWTTRTSTVNFSL